MGMNWKKGLKRLKTETLAEIGAEMAGKDTSDVMDDVDQLLKRIR